MLDERIKALDHELTEMVRNEPAGRRFATIRGVGVMSTTALGALVEMCWERAEQDAALAEATLVRRDHLAPLVGLPVAIKESINVQGLHTTLGSPLFADRVAAEDAPTVAAIRAAGGIIIGKTNVPELMHGGTSQNPIYGLTRNAHDPALSCQASSGGSAVALSASLVPLAAGSDMGGSIRGPSAANGVAGLRPSPGLVVNPALLLAFDVSSVTGPMARSVEDVMLLLAGMICTSPFDPFDWNPDPAPLLNPTPAKAGSLRVAISPDLGFVPVQAAIRARFEEVVSAIAPEVGRIETVTPDLGPINHAFHVLRTLAYLAAYGEVHEKSPERLTPQKNVDLRRGFAATARMVADAQRVQSCAFRALATLFREYDVLITPGASEPLLTIEEVNRREGALRTDNARLALDSYDFDDIPPPTVNLPITWTAHPVATITAGRGPDGMPFGINLIGRYRDDINLLRIALAVEQILGARDGFGRPIPDLSAYVP